jgi:hypothetical protein
VHPELPIIGEVTRRELSTRKSSCGIVPQQIRFVLSMREKSVSIAPSTLTYPQAFESLLRDSPTNLARRDIAEMNLLCAHGLPGAEEMDIREYLGTLNQWTRAIGRRVGELLPYFRANPDSVGMPAECSEAFFRAIYLATALHRDFGVHYDPRYKKPDDSLDYRTIYRDCKYLLMNGTLSEKRYGSCNSIPVLLVAIGRRLGYPVKLACNVWHVWARWESPNGGERFNIDASCDGGADAPDDEHYKSFPHEMPSFGVASGYYLNSFTPADELALFLMSRSWVLQANERFREALPCLARCCFLAPKEPMYPRMAHEIVLDALHVAKYGKVAPRAVIGRGPDTAEIYDLRDHLSAREVAMALNIDGHFHEVGERSGNAILAYKKACETEPDNPDYLADLKRYQQYLDDLTAKTHIRVQELIRTGIPGSSAPSPPVVVSLPAHSPIPSPGSPADLLASARGAQMMAHEAHGLKLEREGKLVEAQVEFVRGWSTSDGHSACRVYLHRAIRKELLAGNAPTPNPSHKPTRKDYENDPRLFLSPELQAAIWAERGRILEDMGRNAESIHCFLCASRLDLHNASYIACLNRIAAENAKQTQQRSTQRTEPPGLIITYSGKPKAVALPARYVAAMPDLSTGLVVGFGPVSKTGLHANSETGQP